ncbi:pyroglutamylated RFamide peptide [Labeo rohita]|uniref:Pyroglutamylated RFamide peptide n=2 Tax=Labeo rohita TaxID=84645 RepID=A0A498LVS0_LABRO|nr:pyroglutamylated RFamide peptide [Labeo rohita]RXN35820.1 pyroglutamylated RFamide peptide [Labeo rohita]
MTSWRFRTRCKMKFQVFHLSSTLQTTVFFLLVLLVQPPRGLMLPHHPMVYLPTLDNPEWEAAMLQLQASLGAPGSRPVAELQPWALIQEPGPEELLERVKAELGWGQRSMVKGQKREELGRTPVGTFPDNHIVAVPYPQGGEVEEEGGEKRNEALTSIAGGLQAFNRQKGGFGFRFGRK